MQLPSDSRRRFGLLALAWWAGLGPARAQLADGADPAARPRWLQVRKALFGTRPIDESGGGPIVLEAPARAEDAAVVPLAVRARIAQTAPHPIRRVVLVIDNNPSPVAATFDFTPASGRADIETRVRIDEYTFVRAIAETSDGALSMSTRFVKASGGCSAPPGKDREAALATLGRMRLQVLAAPAGSAAVPVQLMISHPNDSGLVMDAATRQYTPAHFVRSVQVSYRGAPVLSADLDFAISENPHLRFLFVPQPAGGELRAEAIDSQDRHFEAAVEVAARP